MRKQMMMTIAEAEVKAQNVVNIAWKLIEKKFADDERAMRLLGECPTLSWKKFGFRVAGRYTFYRDKSGPDSIEMNINFLSSKDAKDFVVNTPKHELAHLVANRLFGHSGHDYVWRRVANMIGDDGNRCHNYADPENMPTKNKHVVVCAKCGKEFVVSTRQYNNIVNRGGYRHNVDDGEIIAK